MIIKEEKNGYKLGINDNPDVQHIEEGKRWMVETPDGERFVGNERSIRKLYTQYSS
jgi:hypothetical protein